MTTTRTFTEGEDALFEQIDNDGTMRCTVCGSVDSIASESYPSMYAGDESSETCGICGSYEADSDPFKGTRVIERREGQLLLIPAGDTTMRLVARGGFLYPATSDEHDEANYETDPATLLDVKVGDRVAVTYPHLDWFGTFTVTELQRDQWGLRFHGASWDAAGAGQPMPAGVSPFAETSTHRIARAA